MEKGLEIVGTGDATQPQWLDHLRANLQENDGVFIHDGVAFILTTEIEDREAIHHLVLLPDFEAVEQLRTDLAPHSLNIDDEWGGRPRVNLKGEDLAGIIRDVGGLLGPAHAFTPFRSIFREGRYTSLKDCYGTETQHIRFIELGLSADTEIADHIPELRGVTFITASDAHSPTPDKLGREFVVFEMETPCFYDIAAAIGRRGKKRPVLNVGFDPRLGKYYLSFCTSCRRTLILREGDDPAHYDDLNIYMYCNSKDERVRLLREIHGRRVRCPADGRKLRLGVHDRAMMIGEAESHSPPHRPPYLHIPPLLDLIAFALGVKSKGAKRVINAYREFRAAFGTEAAVLMTADLEELSGVNEMVSRMIAAYRNGTVKYIPGGGGRYGRMIMPWEVDGV